MHLGWWIDFARQVLGLTGVPIPAGRFVLGTGKEGRQYPDWCSVLEFGWGEHPGFRHRGFSCLCPQSSTVWDSRAMLVLALGQILLYRNELQHENMLRSALAGHCWGSGIYRWNGPALGLWSDLYQGRLHDQAHITLWKEVGDTLSYSSQM